eukprot:CAMPEP_0172589460 /NCGR_PEP_ID=MMETSP1068-20121228/8185_1 /TAXON_ID=35684 /ORGANISM="Pseudopedinella elastica, Strain CCMP716" /LENGTH=414 /DNA_ID=CAMNT_0013385067 /DNA_START=3 /DNA_END=1247 /DNA_ORIENTATION=-
MISEEQLESYIVPKGLQNRFDSTQVEKLRRIFATNDKDGGGSIDEAELTVVIKGLEPKATKEQVQEKVTKFMKFDEDGDGKIDFGEFVFMIVRAHDEGHIHLLRSSLINAIIWSLFTFCGSTLAVPKSAGAKHCRHTLMGIHQLAIIMTTAGAAAMLATDLEPEALATNLSELGAVGGTICANTASSVIMKYIQDNNDNGAKVHLSDGFASMIEDLWAGKCDAVIYDGPLLEKALSDAQKKGDGLGFGLVGKALNKDPYGFLLPKDHPLFEAVNKATIDVVRDIEYNQMLDKKYLEHAYDQSTAEDEGTLLTLVFVPLGVILLIALLVYLYYKRKEDEVRHSIQIAVAETKKPLSEKIKSTQQELKNIGKADIAMVPSQDLVHGIALELHDVKKLVCELLVQQSEANAVHVSAP